MLNYTRTAEFSKGGMDAFCGQEDANLGRIAAARFLGAQGVRDIDQAESFRL